MRYVAAYCLAALAGKSPSAKEIENILGAVGVDCDAEKAKKVISELKDKDLQELLVEGKSKIGTMPVGGGGGAPAAAAASDAAPAEEKKPEKEPEPEEESDDDMGFGLFD